MKNYFLDNELACKCCGALVFVPSFKFRLNMARHTARIPFVITSGYRCYDYNKKCGSKDSSSHPKGFAVDISATNSRTRYKIVSALLESGLSRIGISSDFIHVDDDPNKPKDVIWVYK